MPLNTPNNYCLKNPYMSFNTWLQSEKASVASIKYATSWNFGYKTNIWSRKYVAFGFRMSIHNLWTWFKGAKSSYICAFHCDVRRKYRLLMTKDIYRIISLRDKNIFAVWRRVWFYFLTSRGSIMLKRCRFTSSLEA